MENDELENTKRDRSDSESSEVARRGPFKWFVLITFFIYSSSVGVSELIFAPIPKQMAAYYGIKGKYFIISIWYKGYIIGTSVNSYFKFCKHI